MSSGGTTPVERAWVSLVGRYGGVELRSGRPAWVRVRPLECIDGPDRHNGGMICSSVAARFDRFAHATVTAWWCTGVRFTDGPATFEAHIADLQAAVFVSSGDLTEEGAAVARSLLVEFTGSLAELLTVVRGVAS